MKFPSKDKLKKIREELDQVDGSLGLPENPTELERFRHQLQQGFVKYKREHNLTGRAFADTLGVDEAKVSKILHHRLDSFSTDRLLNLYLEIYPEAKLKIA